MPSNSAAYLDARRAALTVREAPYPTPRADEIVIRNRAIAINPLDSIKQASGDTMYGWLKYPIVMGEDVAGEIVEVGTKVTRFRVGDRVLALTVGMEKQRNASAESAFQLYSVALEQLVAPIPDSLAFESAAVLPLAVSTAASALFQTDQLALAHPSVTPVPTGETVLIWGGSTSVGSNAIQLAVAAGYEVISTASPRNHDYVRSLGASRVFDYASPSVVADIVAALRGSTLAGTLAVGTGSAAPCLEVVLASAGSKRLTMASPSVALDSVPHRPGINPQLIAALARLVSSTGALMLRARARGVRARFVWGSSLMNNEVGPLIFERFLPAALAAGSYVAAPTPEVVGQGLELVQGALETLRRGVSAKKLVITLP